MTGRPTGYFHQPELDAALREGVARFANVDVRLRHEATGVLDAGDRVSVTVRDLATGGSSELTARYVVGCDGARSVVRDAIGASMLDLGLHQPWLVVDVVANPESERARRLPDYTVQHCDPRRPMTRVHVKGLRHRWEIMLMPRDDEAQIVEPGRIWPLLAHAVGPEDVRIERSAHLHVPLAGRGPVASRSNGARRRLRPPDPPFLGQGMCAGIRDASNLAWKLALVVAGTAGDSLLDTYEAERSPHVREFIELAVRLGSIIQATDPEVAEARDAAFHANGPELFDFPEPRLGRGVWMDDSPACGAVFPQPRLADGRRLDEAVGNRFAVLSLRPLDVDVRRGGNGRRPGLDLALVDAPGPAAERWLAAQGAVAAIVRPDRYVFATARDEAELHRALDKLDFLLRPRSRPPGRAAVGGKR